jgi:hypothetical protein
MVPQIAGLTGVICSDRRVRYRGSGHSPGGRDIRSLSQAARDLGVGRKLVRRIVREHGIPYRVVGRTWVLGPQAVREIRAALGEVRAGAVGTRSG